MTGREQDPWGDAPHWSEDEQRAQQRAAPSELASGDCPWCATPAAPGAKTCTSCGAALAQRETIGDLVIPGLTAVDPALKDLDGRPLRLAGPSPTHGVASGLVVAAAAGGPIGLTILGGVAAVAAAEYLGAGGQRSGGPGGASVGETSEAVRQALERLEREEAESAGPSEAGTEEASDGG